MAPPENILNFSNAIVYEFLSRKYPSLAGDFKAKCQSVSLCTHLMQSIVIHVVSSENY